MKGSSINEPMTLYYITDVYDDKLRALSIYVGKDMIQGLEYDNEYDNDIPENAVILPSNTYSVIKEQTKEFLKNVHEFLGKNAIHEGFELKVGCHYYDEHIHTITNIGSKRANYELFRLEEENISPNWSGDGNIDTLKKYCLQISEECFQEVLNRYEMLLSDIRRILFK